MTRKKILVVENDADVRLGYHVLLTANQYDTVFAADSSSAVTEARKHQPDLILLGLGLPTGDASMVSDRVPNTHLAGVPVIVVSGNDSDLLTRISQRMAEAITST